MSTHSLPKRLPDQSLIFNVPPSVNGGQEISIETDFYTDSMGGIVIYQEIRLNSYGNSAVLSLGANTLSPAVLRSLADQIEEVQNKLG